MSPLEAMARAIYEAGVQDPDGRIDFPFSPDEPYYKDIARAALTALRDCGVTEGMQEAYKYWAMAPVQPTAWEAMLDAALEEN